MRIVIAPDKFKGSLSAQEVGEHIEAGIRAVVADADLTVVPMADGGEGTLDAALAGGFDRVDVDVSGPLGEPVSAAFALHGDEAVIEMAVASGLELLPPDRRDALAASSRGTGDLIRAAVDAGAKRIVLAIGGSASTDGGAGMLAALGARLLDASGDEIADGGGALAEIASIDLDGLDPRIADTQFVLASDVDHPLLGPRGAACVFAPQKGAAPDQVLLLERGLTAYSRAVQTALGAGEDTPDADADAEGFACLPGAGAAGGVGFGALAVLGAERRPGVDVVVEFTRLRAHLAGADLAITGEGSFDEQSLGGKTPMGVAAAADSLGVPTVAVCGRTTLSEEAWRQAGFRGCFATMDRAADRATSIREAGRLLEEIGRDISREELARRAADAAAAAASGAGATAGTA